MVVETVTWKDFGSMADYFSPAAVPLQKYLDVGSKEMMSPLGLLFGEKAGARTSASSCREMVNELAAV
jgi:hypothetical protein